MGAGVRNRPGGMGNEAGYVVKATGTFTMKSWEEKPYAEIEGAPKIAHAYTTNTYTGEISGESTANYVIVYPEDTVGVFIGYEQIVGRIGDREGSFVVEGRGSWEGGTVTTEWTGIEGMAAGDLAGLTGTGSYVARHEIPETPVTLEYELPRS